MAVAVAFSHPNHHWEGPEREEFFRICSHPYWMFLLQAKWTWGPDGQGAVLLVNCDKDSPSTVGTDSSQVDIHTPAGRAHPRGSYYLTGVFCSISILLVIHDPADGETSCKNSIRHLQCN